MAPAISRRSLLLLAGSTCAAFPAPPLTAQGVLERIQKNVGVPWRNPTVDTIKTGSPETEIRGIATSMFPTLDVLQRAQAAGRNMIIVHEPLFYNHEDSTRELTGEVFRIKQEFLTRHQLVVFRFHDHWHARRPDGVAEGMIAALGWNDYRAAERPRLFTPPPTTLEALGRTLAGRLKLKAGLRIVGDAKMPVKRVALMPGYANLQGIIRAVENPEVDAIVIGETREWEGVEYVRDAVTEGRKKGLIILGHVPSEEEGMRECAGWLRSFIPEVPIDYLPAGEPFWTPR